MATPYITVAEARARQLSLQTRVVRSNLFSEIQLVAGVDVGLKRNSPMARAAVVVLTYPALEIVDSAIALGQMDFPYIPGYLSFREIPIILQALDRLKTKPDILLCDGQGIAHPRRIGLASHLGVVCDLPTVGVAKTRLIGKYIEPGDGKGSWTSLRDKGEIVGAVLRTRRGVKPIFISIGHRIDLNTAIDLVLACCTRFKLPETTRAAHRLASGKN